MREIKFRAWDGFYRRYRQDDWAEHFAVRSDGIIIKRDIYSDHFESYEEDSSLIVEQFTGLRDKNGREIYEGDILSAPIVGFNEPYVFVVEWEDSGDQQYRWHGYTLCHYDASKVEVIGNIHENPELLK